MYPEFIQTFINACQWDNTRFFFISENVFDPFIYYSHLLPLILSLALGLFLFLNNPRKLIIKILFFITSAFSVWVFFDLILWATDKPHITMSLWSIMNLIEVLIYAASFYFLQVFIRKQDSSLKSKILLIIPILPILFLIPSSLSLSGYDLTNCWRDAVEGPLTTYGYVLEILYIIGIVIYAMESFRKSKNREQRKKILLVSTGVLLFLLTLSWGNLVGNISDDWRLAQWGLFGMPIFTAFLAYLIVKYEEFDVKLIGAEALVAAISILVISQYFFVQTLGARVLVSVTLLLTVTMGVALVRGVHREIEQRKRLEEVTKALGQANTKLKKADELKDQFLSFASHDLKSPVVKMKQWASLIRDKTYNTPKQIEETSQKIEVTGDRALRLVDDFLNLRKIEEGQMEYNFEAKNIVALTKEISQDLQSVAQGKELSLSFESKSEDIQIQADDIKIRQVIENLIDNSIKYTEEGSVTVKVEEEQNSALISISDTGTGISKDQINSLFEQFQRAPGVKKTIKGTGLGLYIAKQIVLAHKGEVWAESEGEGKGSRFKVRLPKA